MTALIGVVTVVLMVVVIALIINGIEDYHKGKKKGIASFKDYLELTDLPIITFKQGKRKLNFILDSGANYSVINKKVEEELKSEETSKQSVVLGIHGEVTRTNIKTISFSHGKDVFIEDFQVMDISKTVDKYEKHKGVTIHGVLGNAFMQAYKYVIDFDEKIAYRK